MNAEEIQKEIDALVPLMVDKGLRNPRATFEFHSGTSLPVVWLMSDTKNKAGNDWHRMVGDDIPDILANAREFISELPDPEEAKRQEFINQLAALIDLGRENGIDLAFVNPLQETMKRLAENALTHEPT